MLDTVVFGVASIVLDGVLCYIVAYCGIFCTDTVGYCSVRCTVWCTVGE